MAAFFGFGAFSSPAGQLIERATDNAASEDNLALHLQICDEINETDRGPKDAITAIRKRLTSNIKNLHIINLTLTVLETCVKNCGFQFHVKIAQRDFLGDLMKVIHPKNNPPTIVQKHILGLIQYWADAFKGKPQLVAVIELYDQLKSDGTEFPPVDLDAMAPVETPERGVKARVSLEENKILRMQMEMGKHEPSSSTPEQPVSSMPELAVSKATSPEVTELQQALREKDAMLVKLAEQLGQFQKTARDLSKIVEHSKGQSKVTKDLKEELAKEKGVNGQLRDELATLQEKARVSLEENKILPMQMEMRSSHAQWLRGEVAKLKKEVETKENEILRMQMEMGKHEPSSSTPEQPVSSMPELAVSKATSPSPEVAELQQALREKEAMLVKLSEQLRQFQKTTRDLSKIVEHSKGQSKVILDLMQELKKEKGEKSELLAQKDELHVAKESVQAEIDSLQKSRGGLETALIASRNTNDRLREEREKLKTKNKLADSQLRELQGVNVQLMDELATLQEKARVSLDTALRDRAHWQQKSISQQFNLDNMAQDLAQKRREVTQMSATIAEQDNELQRLGKQNTDLLSVVEVHRVTAQTFQEDFTQERKDREQAQGRLADMEKHYTEQMERIGAMETVQEVTHLRQQLEEQSANSQQLQQRHHDVLAQLQEMRSQRFEFWRISPKDVDVLPGEEHVIGRGAWGYVAEGTFRGQRVAVKCLHQAIRDPRTVERVNREICTMAQVRHPNLVLFLAAVYEQGSPPMIVTELLDVDLRTAYETGRLQGSSKLVIFRDVACALNYLHQHREPIIHRDVSAPNVLLEALAGGVWKAKVSDFGSANLARYSKTLAEGAIVYAAPETYPQRPGAQPLPQTTKIDVYSYGVLLCEVIIGEIPEPEQLRIKALEVRKQWLSMYNLIESCIQWEATDRPTMAKILTDLPQPLPRMHSSS